MAEMESLLSSSPMQTMRINPDVMALHGLLSPLRQDARSLSPHTASPVYNYSLNVDLAILTTVASGLPNPHATTYRSPNPTYTTLTLLF